MICKPKDARYMYCPLSLVNSSEDDRFCHGPACMAWVWMDTGKQQGRCGMVQYEPWEKESD